MICTSLRKIFGFHYLANLNPQSKEIHYLPKVKTNCGLKYLKKGKYLTKKGMLKYLEKGYNGCAHCLTEYNKD